MIIEITRSTGEALYRQTWRYQCSLSHSPTGAMEIRLISWCEERRPTRRHKWQKSGEGYRYRSWKDYRIDHGWALPAADVPRPQDEALRIKAALLDRLKIIGPEEPQR